MEYKLKLSNGATLPYQAIHSRDAVRKAFALLNISGRIRLTKFIAAGGVAIYLNSVKIFPIQ